MLHLSDVISYLKLSKKKKLARVDANMIGDNNKLSI